MLVRALIEQGLRSGEFRRGVDPTRATLVLNAVYTAVLNAWAGSSPGGYDLSSEMRAHVFMALDGLAL